MTSLLAAAATVAVFALAGPVSAQPPAPPALAPANQLEAAALPPWVQDDGSSSNHPIPMASDRSGEALNSQYRDGIAIVAPPGVPRPPGLPDADFPA